MNCFRTWILLGLLSSPAAAWPQIDTKLSVPTKEGKVLEVICDDKDPTVFYRLPHEFAVARDENGFDVQVIERPTATIYDFTWRAEDWSGEIQDLHAALKKTLGLEPQVRVIFPSLQTIGLDPDLLDVYEAQFENFAEVGPFVPDSRQTLRLTVPKKHVARFRKALVQGSGFYLPLTFAMNLPNPDRPGELISLPYFSTLFLGGLSSCALIPSLNC